METPSKRSPHEVLAREERQREWSKISIEQYSKDLDLSVAELEGKHVLDIGADGGAFVRAANDAGAFAVAFDLPFNNPPETRRVTGNAVNLPFKDRAFDLVISHAALPHFVIPENVPFEHGEGIPAHEARVSAMAEAIRVLKKGGEIRMSTVRNEQPDEFKRNDSLKALLQSLKNDPSLEVIEELLEETNKIAKNKKTSESYRLIIRKK